MRTFAAISSAVDAAVIINIVTVPAASGLVETLNRVSFAVVNALIIRATCEDFELHELGMGLSGVEREREMRGERGDEDHVMHSEQTEGISRKYDVSYISKQYNMAKLCTHGKLVPQSLEVGLLIGGRRSILVHVRRGVLLDAIGRSTEQLGGGGIGGRDAGNGTEEGGE